MKGEKNRKQDQKEPMVRPLRWRYYPKKHFKISYWLWASLVAQVVKNLPEAQETQVQSLGQEDTLEKGTHPLQYSFLENSVDRGAW